jgi:hypothetical protein
MNGKQRNLLAHLLGGRRIGFKSVPRRTGGISFRYFLAAPGGKLMEGTRVDEPDVMVLIDRGYVRCAQDSYVISDKGVAEMRRQLTNQTGGAGQ